MAVLDQALRDNKELQYEVAQITIRKYFQPHEGVNYFIRELMKG